MEISRSHTSNQLTLEVTEESEHITVAWIGKSADREPGDFILPILLDTLQLCEKKGKSMIMEMKDLEYMNSSSITPVSRILDKSASGSVEITIRYDGSRKWQELNFSAMKIFEKKNNRNYLII